MFKLSLSIRLWTTAALLAGAFVLLQGVSHGEIAVPHGPLRDLPYTLGSWTANEQPFTEQVLKLLGVSDYTNRIYFSQQKELAQLYVGYYASQKTGDTIHSPKNCLPVACWDPIQSGYATISVSGGRQIVVNAYVIQHGLDKQLVFYWEHGRGGIITSDYSGKFWMIADAMPPHRRHRPSARLFIPMND